MPELVVPRKNQPASDARSSNSNLLELIVLFPGFILTSTVSYHLIELVLMFYHL